MSKTIRQIVREEIDLTKLLEKRREQLKLLLPTMELDFVRGYFYFPSIESMRASAQFVERQLKKEFGKDYRKP